MLSRFYETLKAADKIIYVCDYYHGRYHSRDRFMVDHSCEVISLLRRPHSGTAYTVGYARKRGKHVIQL